MLPKPVPVVGQEVGGEALRVERGCQGLNGGGLGCDELGADLAAWVACPQASHGIGIARVAG